jgi:anti-sigma regulatory factor (Ser/Thr protein kinase)
MSTLHLTLPRSVASPARARREASRFAAAHDVSNRAEPALVVLSELVTNAVLHGAEPIQASVSCHEDALRIEVFDGDPDTSELVPVAARDAVDPGGRGLQIVDALSRSWGVTRRGEGKTVWAEVAFENQA